MRLPRSWRAGAVCCAWAGAGCKARSPVSVSTPTTHAAGRDCEQICFGHRVGGKNESEIAMLPETLPSMNSKSAKPRITRHPDGIFAVDAEYVRPGYAAVHIIQHNGRAAFVDTGTNHSVPHLLAALDELGIAYDSVDYVFLTHVHMDHAGGAGLLIQQLPNARVLIHPRGVPHMIDPSKLVAASQAVYGVEEFRKLYGDVLPVPQDRIVNVPDNYRCEPRRPRAGTDSYAGPRVASLRRSLIVSTPLSSRAIRLGCRIGHSIRRRARSSFQRARPRNLIRIN